jgi:L-ascorbate metabolism protein UlaG (beta-lactamase superfamily)
MNTIQYLGHSAFRVQLENIVALIDPAVGSTVLGSPRRIPSALDPHMVKECDLILLTHEQPDHCEPDVVKEIAERTFATVVAPKPALAKIDVSERFKVDVRAGDKFTIKGIDIEVVRAVYPQSTYPVGYVLRSARYGVYHAGATYSYPDMNKIKCDVALMPIGGTYTMDPFDAANACKEMRPKYVIPMHYNTCERIAQEVSEFTNDLGAHTKAIVLAPGQTAKLP